MATYNGATWMAYVDNAAGVPVNVGTDTVLGGTLYVGSFFNGQQSIYNFNGLISNVQIYNISLSSSQVESLYQEGIGGAPIDPLYLQGWWPLNGNTNDYSGNGNNGVPTNVLYTSSWTSGYSQP